MLVKASASGLDPSELIESDLVARPGVSKTSFLFATLRRPLGFERGME